MPIPKRETHAPGVTEPDDWKLAPLRICVTTAGAPSGAGLTEPVIVSCADTTVESAPTYWSMRAVRFSEAIADTGVQVPVQFPAPSSVRTTVAGSFVPMMSCTDAPPA